MWKLLLKASTVHGCLWFEVHSQREYRSLFVRAQLLTGKQPWSQPGQRSPSPHWPAEWPPCCPPWAPLCSDVWGETGATQAVSDSLSHVGKKLWGWLIPGCTRECLTASVGPITPGTAFLMTIQNWDTDQVLVTRRLFQFLLCTHVHFSHQYPKLIWFQRDYILLSLSWNLGSFSPFYPLFLHLFTSYILATLSSLDLRFSFFQSVGCPPLQDHGTAQGFQVLLEYMNKK